MLISIAQPIRKIALDFSLLRKIPGFLTNPIEAVKKFLLDAFKKSEITLQDALKVVNKNVKTAFNIKPIILIALTFLTITYGSRVAGEWLTEHFSEKIAPEKAHQTEVMKVINEK